MKTSRILLLSCAASVGLAGCALDFGDRNGGSRSVDQDISSTRDAGPTSSNLDPPMMR